MNPKNIDALPEEIRSHILSLMPTEFAVQTSVLSKTWRYTWTLVPNLDFDDTRSSIYNLDSFTKFMDRVFNSYKTSKLNIYRLHLGIEYLNVSTWVDEAVKLNVRELSIRVHVNLLHDLPLSVFTCITLTMLRLHHVNCTWECPWRVSLPCLKTLDIIVHSNPFANAFKLIRGCPVLESLLLQVDSCKGEQPYIFSIPTLKRLKLKMTNRVYVFHEVVLRLPCLEYICVGGCLSSVFVMEDLPALVEASISLQSVTNSDLWFQLLKGISGVKSLSIRDLLFEMRRVPIFPNLKHLELKSFKDEGLMISRFLKHCPELKHLRLGMKFERCFWMKPKVVPGCIRTNVTTLKYSLCKWTAKYDLKFLKYLLGNAEVLKTVTISFEEFSRKEEMWFHTELLKFPKASMDCAIISSGTGRWFASLK